MEIVGFDDGSRHGRIAVRTRPKNVLCTAITSFTSFMYRKAISYLIVMMTAVDWWKTLAGALLPAISLTGAEWNFLRIIGKARDAAGLHGCAAHPITVYPHLSHV
jgi:hypothetical protein